MCSCFELPLMMRCSQGSFAGSCSHEDAVDEELEAWSLKTRLLSEAPRCRASACAVGRRWVRSFGRNGKCADAQFEATLPAVDLGESRNVDFARSYLGNRLAQGHEILHTVGSMFELLSVKISLPWDDYLRSYARWRQGSRSNLVAFQLFSS